MTTEELVEMFIEALKDGQLDRRQLESAFMLFGPRVIVDEEDREVWSIALNFETRDVRYIEVNGGQGTIREVKPEIRKEVTVQYV